MKKNCDQIRIAVPTYNCEQKQQNKQNGTLEAIGINTHMTGFNTGRIRKKIINVF